MYEFIESLEALLNNNFTYTIIFILGMFHALEPGHGKTLILAYLSGGSIQTAGSLKIISGLILTHFILFSFIAFLLKTGGESFPILELIGPILIICLGSYLFYRSMKETRHEHEEDCDDPMHFHFNDTKFASPFVTGMVAGLIPCPSAIAVLLIAANKFYILPNDIVFIPATRLVEWNAVISLLTPSETLFKTYKPYIKENDNWYIENSKTQ